MNGRLPTGVDRVTLAYVQRYGDRSRAFVRDGHFSVVLPPKTSQSLFRILLTPPVDFKAHAWRLIAVGAAVGWCSKGVAGSLFLNIGHSGLEYHRYPEILRRLKVRPVFMVHDLIPLTHPEYCRPGEADKHRIRMQTVLSLAQGVVTNSQATLDELSLFAVSQGASVPPSAPAFLAPPLFFVDNNVNPSEKPYFVVLGTIEPRKNHLMLLQVWRRLAERLGERAPRLVVIGQRGWECENTIDMLERCEQLKGCVTELPACSDSELASWLCHARALLFPSFAEGYGLPLVEALSLGTPVIASDLKVFREIAGDIPEYLDPLDGSGWMAMIERYLDEQGSERNQQLERMSDFVAPTWEQHFKQVDALLERVAG